MQLYSISIHPKPNIGYAFAVQAENPKHALSVLSFHIRNCMKEGVEDRRFVETLRMLRKYWRYHVGRSFNENYLWRAVKVAPVSAIAISYDQPLIPLRHENGIHVHNYLGYTGDSAIPKANLSPRNKPHTKGPQESGR